LGGVTFSYYCGCVWIDWT